MNGKTKILIPDWVKKTLVGLLVPFLTAVIYAGGVAGLAAADERYMLRAESKEALISQYRAAIYLLRKGGVTPSEQEDIDFYNYEIQRLGGDPT